MSLTIRPYAGPCHSTHLSSAKAKTWTVTSLKTRLLSSQLDTRQLTPEKAEIFSDIAGAIDPEYSANFYQFARMVIERTIPGIQSEYPRNQQIIVFNHMCRREFLEKAIAPLNREALGLLMVFLATLSRPNESDPIKLLNLRDRAQHLAATRRIERNVGILSLPDQPGSALALFSQPADLMKQAKIMVEQVSANRAREREREIIAEIRPILEEMAEEDLDAFHRAIRKGWEGLYVRCIDEPWFEDVVELFDEDFPQQIPEHLHATLIDQILELLRRPHRQ